MDPQKLSNLDPKLRDAYQRVMGTTIPDPQTPASTPVQAPTQPTDQPTIPTTDPTPAPQPQPEPAIPQMPTPEPQSIPTSQPDPTQPASNFTQMNSEIAAPTVGASNFASPAFQTQSMAIKKKSKIMPILFVFLGLIFLVIYTLFWTKFFNFKLPFLPQLP
jgi:uncharacterized membrane protein